MLPKRPDDVEALPAPPACKNGINDICVSILFLKSDYKISLTSITRFNVEINGYVVIPNWFRNLLNEFSKGFVEFFEGRIVRIYGNYLA